MLTLSKDISDEQINTAHHQRRGESRKNR
jgi:hypothetical protein